MEPKPERPVRWGRPSGDVFLCASAHVFIVGKPLFTLLARLIVPRGVTHLKPLQPVRTALLV